MDQEQYFENNSRRRWRLPPLGLPLGFCSAAQLPLILLVAKSHDIVPLKILEQLTIERIEQEIKWCAAT
jgi:hypothetical protein